jgi:hypothetical protein
MTTRQKVPPTITPELLALIPWEMLTSEMGRRRAAMREPGTFGRQPVLKPCPVCKVKLSATERRKHSSNWCRLDRAAKQKAIKEFSDKRKARSATP